MGILDIILAITLGYGLVRGVFNGFFMEFASLVSLALGIFLAVKFSSALAQLMSTKVSWDPLVVRLACFIVLFLGAIILISMLARLFTTMASFAGIGILNRILGGIFGMMKLALVIGTLLTLMARYDLPGAEAKSASILYEPVYGFGKMLYPSLAEWIPDIPAKV